MNRFYLTVQQSCELREILEALVMILDSPKFFGAAFSPIVEGLASLSDSLSPMSPIRQLIQAILSVPLERPLKRDAMAKIRNAIDELWGRCCFDDPIFLSSKEVQDKPFSFSEFAFKPREEQR